MEFFKGCVNIKGIPRPNQANFVICMDLIAVVDFVREKISKRPS